MISDKEKQQLKAQNEWLLTNIESDRAQVDEATFKRLFLPLLLGQIPEDQLEEVGYLPWIAVAGSVTRSVDITRNGEVIYTVPPLLNTTGLTSVNRQPSQDIGERLNTTLREVERYPIKGGQRIAQTLIDSVSKAQQNETHQAMWAQVLKENGLQVSNTAPAPTKEQADKDTGLYDDYEDL